MSQLTNAVREALSGYEMVAVSSDVKNLVCDELARVDPTAAIRRTDYFNHSYIPDVVMEWPDQPLRQVFMRFVNDPHRLEDDLRRIGRDGPVLFDLSTAVGDAQEAAHDDPDREFNAALDCAPTVLLTDTEATAHVRPATSQNLVERLVSGNMLRAGRGYLDAQTAREAVEASRAGFDGAVAAEPEAVKLAVEVAQKVFGLDLERRIERSLQLVWWAGGGDPSTFPISLPDDMGLNADDTRDFLRSVLADQQEIDDDGFWTRLAHRLDFDTLVSVGDVDGGANLHRLMKHLAARLALSHAALDRDNRKLIPEPLAWALMDGFLRLRGPDWVCRFTPAGQRFSQRRSKGAPIALDAAVARSAGLIIEEAAIEDADRMLQVRRKAATPSNYQQASLAALAAGIPVALVRELTIRSGSDSLSVEFDRMMVWSDKNPTVPQLAVAAVRLLAAPPVEELDDLIQFLESATV